MAHDSPPVLDSAGVWWLDEEPLINESSCVEGSAKCTEGLFDISVIEFIRDFERDENKLPCSYTKSRVTCQVPATAKGCSHQIFRHIAHLQKTLRESQPLKNGLAIYSRVLLRSDCAVVTPVDVIHIESLAAVPEKGRQGSTGSSLVTTGPKLAHHKLVTPSEDSPTILPVSTPSSPALPPHAPEVSAPQQKSPQSNGSAASTLASSPLHNVSKIDAAAQSNPLKSAEEKASPKQTPISSETKRTAQDDTKMGNSHMSPNIQISIGGQQMNNNVTDKNDSSLSGALEKSRKRLGRTLSADAPASPSPSRGSSRKRSSRLSSARPLTESKSSLLGQPSSPSRFTGSVVPHTTVNVKNSTLGSRTAPLRLKRRPPITRRSEPMSPREYTEVFEYMEEEVVQVTPNEVATSLPKSTVQESPVRTLTRTGSVPSCPVTRAPLASAPKSIAYISSPSIPISSYTSTNTYTTPAPPSRTYSGGVPTYTAPSQASTTTTSTRAFPLTTSAPISNVASTPLSQSGSNYRTPSSPSVAKAPASYSRVLSSPTYSKQISDIVRPPPYYYSEGSRFISPPLQTYTQTQTPVGLTTAPTYYSSPLDPSIVESRTYSSALPVQGTEYNLTAQIPTQQQQAPATLTLPIPAYHRTPGSPASYTQVIGAKDASPSSISTKATPTLYVRTEEPTSTSLTPTYVHHTIDDRSPSKTVKESSPGSKNGADDGASHASSQNGYKQTRTLKIRANKKVEYKEKSKT